MNKSTLQTIEEDEPKGAVSVSILKEKFLANPDQEKAPKPESKVDYHAILKDQEILKKKEVAFEEKEKAFAKEEQVFKAEVKKLRQREITMK